MNKRKSKIWIIFILVLIILIAGILCIGFNKDKEKCSNSKTEKKVTEVTTEEVKEIDDGSEEFAIFGVDTRAKNLDKGTRSDSLMIVRVDHTNKKVKVLSIYRDCMVKIRNHGYEKITHAHSYGGADLAMETLNTNFDLDVHKYVTVNFIAVADLIDDIGGIEQKLTESEVKYINGYIREVNKVRGTHSAEITEAGTYLLDGTQAVAYTRIRYTAGGDYKRADRQRTILFKIFEASKELDRAKRLDLLEKEMHEIKTNYNSNHLSEILYYLSKYEMDKMDAFPKVFYGGKVDGAWVEVPVTLKKMVKGIHKELYGEEDYQPSLTVGNISSVLSSKCSKANNDLTDGVD